MMTRTVPEITYKGQIPRVGSDVEGDGLGGNDPLLLDDIPGGDILSSDPEWRRVSHA
jgi:hypothetical protein